MQIRRCALGTLCALLCAATLVAQDAKKEDKPTKSDEPAAAKVGQPAPNFTLLDTEGKKHTLADYKDKIVVLEWVNQQCPWSVKAVPTVKDIRKKYAEKGVVWLGIDSTHGRTPEENAKYSKDKSLGFPILMDPDGKVGHLYAAKVTPHMFIIHKGTLVYAGALHNNQQDDKKGADVRMYVDESIAAVLDGKAVPVAETKPWGCTVKYRDDKKARS